MKFVCVTWRNGFTEVIPFKSEKSAKEWASMVLISAKAVSFRDVPITDPVAASDVNGCTEDEYFIRRDLAKRGRPSQLYRHVCRVA